ncbi:MAG: ABC transporter permease [Ktedonobacteraceae bacterium]
MKASNKKVLQDIAQRRIRTLLTILGIAIGILGLSAINVASSQFKTSFDYSANITAQPDIKFYINPTTINVVPILRQQPNVKAVQAQDDINTRWNTTSQPTLIEIKGIVDFQHIQLNKFTLVEGHLPGDGEILLDASDKVLGNVQVGSQIPIQVNGVYRNVTVSGFERTQGLAQESMEGKAYGFMSQNAFESFFQQHGINNIIIQVKNYAQRYATVTQLSQVMTAHHTPVVGTDVGRNEDVANTANGLFAIMNIVSVIAILLSVFLLLGTVTALIAEQTKIIGTMKAVGATRGQIMRHYLTLVTLYSLIGTTIGIVLGIIGGYQLALYLGNLVNIPIGPLQVTPYQIVEGLLVGIGTPLLAAALPLYFATRVTVKQALSGYGIENNTSRGRVWAPLTGFAFALFPQTVQFGVRSMFRKRTRTLLTLLALAFAGIAFLAVQTASYSFDNLLNQMYSTYNFDAAVSVDNPQPFHKFDQLLGSIPGVKRIESQSVDTASTDWGNAALTGVLQNTRIYQKHVIAGRWFTSTDTNVVLISKDAANISGLKVGDTVSFYLGLQQLHWQIIGIVNDESGIGPGNLGAFVAPLQQINAVKQLPADYTQSVMLQLSNRNATPAQINTLVSTIDTRMSDAGFLPAITTRQQEIDQAHSKYDIIYILLDAVAIIVGLVGAIGLSNSLAMSVLERRREIGILRSMGAISSKVAQVFWTEGTALGLLAWLAALVLGIPAAYGFVFIQAKVLAPVPFAFNPINLLWMLLLIIVLTSVASLGPTLGAARVRINQVLHYE